MKIVPALTRLLPFLNWPRPDATLLRGEALAGLTVGLMVVPQGMAYASLAGMPLITGVYASLLPALVAALFGASARLAVGPTALSALLVGASLSGLATPGSASWVDLAIWLALLSGLMQIVLGFARFGWLLNLVSAPVLMAFTQAAGVLIVVSQLPALLGVAGQPPPWQGWPTPHWPSVAFGLGSLAILLALRRWRPSFPTVLILLVACAAISRWTGFEAAGGAVVGAVPAGLPAPRLPSLPDASVLAQLLMPTLMITLVSFLETAASARIDNDANGRRWDQDQDLIGQGLAKIASGVSGAFPTSSSFSRSALNLYAGARTGWATVFSVVVVLVILLFLTPLLKHAPHAMLAAVVVAAVLGLIRPREFLLTWRVSRVEGAIALATFAITLFTAPRLYWGVLAGVVMALSHFIYERLHPRIIEVGLHPDGSLRDRHLWGLPPLAERVYALRMDAALDFATADAFERTVIAYLSAHPETRRVCLIAQPINRIDITGAAAFVKLGSRLRTQGIELHVSGMKLPVETMLRAAGALPDDSGPVLHRTDADLLARLELEPEASQTCPTTACGT